MSKRTLIGGKSIDPASPLASVKWQAYWLRDPVFGGLEYRELIDPNRSEKQNGEIQNIHTFFRRELTPGVRPVRQARLYITADDCYKLYINGSFIGVGPAPAYPYDYPYNAWDVTEALKAGVRNCIGVHVFYQGMHSLTFPSGDNLQGLLLQLEIDYEDGSSVTCVSDADWRCSRVDAYESRQVYGYQTAFSEHIDLRKLPVGWSEAGYSDSQWQTPSAGVVPAIYSLSPQRTPPVAVFNRLPDRVVKMGDGHYFIDFGTELSGETAFTVSGKAGHEVEILHGEELNGDGSVRYKMRCNCTYQEYCKLSGKPDERLEFFDYKGFRYVEVLNWPEELAGGRVWAHERHYPFPEQASSFNSSNKLLNDIWALCRNGVRVGTIDTYLDCPTREKGGFMGDGFVTGISHLILTGDSRILRKFLKDVADTSRYCPGLHSTAPNYVNGELAEYSMLWPVLLEYYYQWTGDAKFVREMLPVLEGMLGYYAGYENDDGLLQDLYSKATGRYSVLVDWPKNLRDDYDDPYLMGARTEKENPHGVVNTMVQGFYLCALNAAARLADVAGSSSLKQSLKGRAEKLRAAVLSKLRDPETGIFVDRNGSSHRSLHANVTPLMSGMLSPEEAGPVIELIRKKRLSCGVYFSFFVLKALYDMGESDLAYDLIASRDLHSWNSMLEAGATTCMEAWAPDLKWNTSWCHPWSSAPVYMVAHELMGIRPGKPGWVDILFSPHVPAGMDSASLAMTIPQGLLKIGFSRDGNGTTYSLTIPSGCKAVCRFEHGERIMAVDGEDVHIGASELKEIPEGAHVINTKLP
jgi:alpha-L-rhamnosidase